MPRPTTALALVGVLLLAGCLTPAANDGGDEGPSSILDERQPTTAARFHWTPDDGAADITLAASLWQPEDGATTVVLAVHGSGGNRAGYGPIPVPGYSFAHGLVAGGRSVVAVDLPGYGESALSTPQTMEDMAYLLDRVADALRSGTYEKEGGQAPAFETVVGLGISMGGLLVQMAQANHDSFDGVVSGSWSYGGFSEAYRACRWGGQGCPENPVETLWYLPNVEPAVVEFLNTQEGGPPPLGPVGAVSINTWAGCIVPPGPPPRPGTCGTGAVHEERVRTVTEEVRVPLLLAFGERDWYWEAEDVAREPSRFVNAENVTTMMLPDTGHVYMWHYTNQALHERQNSWLDAHGL